MPNIQDYISRFMKKSRVIGEHWIWDGARNKRTQHGQVSIDGKLLYIHRFIFCLVNNFNYDDDFYTCHKPDCNIPACWNPDHMYKGTNQSNQKDIVNLGYHREAIKTHCPRGHELWKRAKNGKRICIECNRLRDRNRKRITVNSRRVTVQGTRKI